MSDIANENYPVDPAIECYRAYPPDETTDPDVTHLARRLADILLRVHRRRLITASTFTTLASLTIGDLKRGRSGFTTKSLADHPLANRDAEVYDKLYTSLPELAEQGFSEQFGSVVRIQLLQMSVLKPEDTEKPTLDTNE